MGLPAHEYLERLAIPFRPLSFPTDTQKGAANVARALGYREGQLVKTLLFETDRGERALVLVAANLSAISGLLKKALGSRNIRLASPDAVKQTTGYEIGSVPPFHWQPTGFRTLMDAALLREPILGVGGGEWGQEILIAPLDLVRASGATVVELTRPMGTET